MKTRQNLIVTSLLLAFPASTIALAEPAFLPVQRTLTDTAGRKMEVMIFSKTDTSVRVRRVSDAQEFEIPIVKLSDEDRAFLTINKPEDTKPEAAAPPKAAAKPAAASPRPSPTPETSRGLLENIPSLENQLSELTTEADRFQQDPKRQKDAKDLRQRIDKARDGATDPLVELSSLIRMFHSTRGFPEGARRSFDVLRLALVNETPKALNQLFVNFSWGDGIPHNYSDECYAIAKRHAENGNPAAMIALGCAHLDGHGMSRREAAELRRQFPDEPNQQVRIGVEWLEKAMQAKPTPDQLHSIQYLLAKGYKYNNQPEKALPLLIDGANHGDPWLMRHLADLYYEGKGCDRDLTKAEAWYAKAAAGGVKSGQLEAVRAELKYGCRIFKTTFTGTEVPLRVYGPADSKKAVVIFGSSGFRANAFCGNVSAFEPVFQAGWNVVVFDYPATGPFREIQQSIRKWTWPVDQSMPPSFADLKFPEFPGFGEAIVQTLRNEARYEHLLMVGNSLGAGVMAWDLEKIQQAIPTRALWISPTEMFLPETTKLKALRDVEVIAALEGDLFVRSGELKTWIQTHAVPPGTAGKPAAGHLILGQQFSYQDLVDYLKPRLR